jgi:hypothetical protein
MNDEAAHLVDQVLPEVATRQWVLSFPYKLGDTLFRIFESDFNEIRRAGSSDCSVLLRAFSGYCGHYWSLNLGGMYRSKHRRF